MLLAAMFTHSLLLSISILIKNVIADNTTILGIHYYGPSGAPEYQTTTQSGSVLTYSMSYEVMGDPSSEELAYQLSQVTTVPSGPARHASIYTTHVSGNVDTLVSFVPGNNGSSAYGGGTNGGPSTSNTLSGGQYNATAAPDPGSHSSIVPSTMSFNVSSATSSSHASASAGPHPATSTGAQSTPLSSGTVNGTAPGMLSTTSSSSAANMTGGQIALIPVTASNGKSTTSVEYSAIETQVQTTINGLPTETPITAWKCLGPLCDSGCPIPILCGNEIHGGLDGFSLPSPPSGPPSPPPPESDGPGDSPVQSGEPPENPTSNPSASPSSSASLSTGASSHSSCTSTTVPFCTKSVDTYTPSGASTLSTSTSTICSTITTCGLGSTTLVTSTGSACTKFTLAPVQNNSAWASVEDNLGAAGVTGQYLTAIPSAITTDSGTEYFAWGTASAAVNISTSANSSATAFISTNTSTSSSASISATSTRPPTSSATPPPKKTTNSPTPISSAPVCPTGSEGNAPSCSECPDGVQSPCQSFFEGASYICYCNDPCGEIACTD